MKNSFNDSEDNMFQPYYGLTNSLICFSSVYLWHDGPKKSAGLIGGAWNADCVCWVGVCSPHPLVSGREPAGCCVNANRSPQWLSRCSSSVGQHPGWQLSTLPGHPVDTEYLTCGIFDFAEKGFADRYPALFIIIDMKIWVYWPFWCFLHGKKLGREVKMWS